jgi:hypothetical protein
MKVRRRQMCQRNLLQDEMIAWGPGSFSPGVFTKRICKCE